MGLVGGGVEERAQESGGLNSLQIAWTVFLAPVFRDGGDIGQKQTPGCHIGPPRNAAQRTCVSTPGVLPGALLPSPSSPPFLAFEKQGIHVVLKMWSLDQ